MQSTGHTSTHELSLVPMHGSLITYAKRHPQGSFTHPEWANYHAWREVDLHQRVAALRLAGSARPANPAVGEGGVDVGRCRQGTSPLTPPSQLSRPLAR